MYEETPRRSTLLTWEFQKLDLILLADESYHGKKAIDVMKQLDSDRYSLSYCQHTRRMSTIITAIQKFVIL